MKKIVIGILAHVDSGKTTLTEGMLFRSGEIRRLGRVDHGDTFLDTNEIEREKGITIFSKQAIMRFEDTEFIILDTPGHVDFSSETERTLQVLDYAILVISGTDGVQNHTETLWKLLAEYKIPTFIFVNKMDISQKTREELTDEFKNKLSDACVDFSERESEEFAENTAICEEELMNMFLDKGVVTDEAITAAIAQRKIFPCFFGSALKVEGIDEFLKAFSHYTKMPKHYEEFGAKVFKITEDESGKRLTHMKITGGAMRAKMLVTGHMRNGDKWEEKADRLRIYNGDKFTVTDCAKAGDVVAVTGLTQTFAGEGIGCEGNSATPYLEPVLSYRINILDGTNPHVALMKLRRLEEEEPQLHIIWNEVHREIHIQLMGEVQIEVLRRIIRERFNLEVDFGKGSISYKETILNTVEGVGHFEPLRHYSEVHLKLEPLERGKGLVFATECSEDILDKNWQRLIMTHLEEKQHIGVLTGSAVTDMKITLIAGKAHKKHTEGGDFRQATYRAVRHGLRCAESILLEPYYNFRIELPTGNVGRAMTDIRQMGGEFSQPETMGDISVIGGFAPVSEMRDYHTELTSYTGGRGRLYCTVKGYEPCHNAEEVIESIGYDADADLENPCGSVFCANGAGFTVNWDEVTEYMHIEPQLGDKGDDDFDTDVKVSRYVNAVVNDEELLRIFEKTYGPVKKTYTAMQKRKHPTALKSTSKTRHMPVGGLLYLLVDGYNIIFAWDELKKLSEENLDLARETLINRMCNYQGYKQCELILVFDAYRVKNNPGKIERVHNINVVYTKEAETADMYIEKVTHEIGRKYRVRVATSDNLEQIIILGNGAARVSAAEFQKEVETAENEIRKFIKQTF